MPVGIPFTKGDPRINRNGRPRTFDAVREIAQSICHEELELKDGRKIQVVEAVLRAWAKSPEPQLQKAFIEYAFGKVPDKVHVGDIDGKSTKPMVIQVITPAASPLNERVN